MSTPLIFLDTETTGLDPALHEIWELAYAPEDGDVRSYLLPHSLRTADPEALKLNGYWGRANSSPATDAYDVELREVLTGATIVGANPAFDTAFLRARWGVAPWHHRLIDVETLGLAVLAHERPKGLHALAEELRWLGYDIPAPDHTAGGDVLTTRAVYKALRLIA